jgi:hypothetical protein
MERCLMNDSNAMQNFFYFFIDDRAGNGALEMETGGKKLMKYASIKLQSFCLFDDKLTLRDLKLNPRSGAKG